MNEPSPQYAIAIDTNIFEHLFNPQENQHQHITKLLQHLQNEDYSILVDSDQRIQKEYLYLVDTRLDNDDNLNETQLLRYWMTPDIAVKITVSGTDRLMNAIRGVMNCHNQRTDRTFVYVAFSQGKNLVSNDYPDIINNRTKLKQKSKRVCPACRQSQILDSQEAYSDFQDTT